MKRWLPEKTKEEWAEEQVLEALSDLGIGFEEKQTKQQSERETNKDLKKVA